MPPKKRVSAPANRVYESARPKVQTRLPAPKTRVRRSYGKKGGPQVPKPQEDSTLTQMGYVTFESPRVEAEEEEDEDDMDYEEASSKRGNKRRKVSSSKSESSKFHTQTFSQMNWSFNSNEEDNPPNDEADVDEDIFDGPYSSPKGKGAMKPPALPPPTKPSPRRSPRRTQAPSTSMPPPQTPRRILRQEIPSSQSPATPLSIRSTRSTSRSPLKEKSINTPIPFNAGRRNEKSPGKVPKLVVQDTFLTATEISENSQVPSSPARRSSGVKSVRFALHGGEEEVLGSSPAGRRKGQSPRDDRVVFDSDESDEDIADVEEESEIEGLVERSPEEVEEQDIGLEETEEQDIGETVVEEEEIVPITAHEEAETCPNTYGEFGLETQMEAGKLVDLASSSTEPVEEAAETRNPEPVDEDADVEAIEEAGVEDAEDDDLPERTQMMESQRLTTKQKHAMAPRTLQSDIFVQINPTRLAGLVERKRDHETKHFIIPSTVARVWMYETAPVARLKYMAVFGPAKRPGEITDESYEGNAKFNASTSTKLYAYEVLELYELAHPQSRADLTSKEWLEWPLPTFKWVPPVVIDHLMANLKPQLYGPNVAVEETPPSSANDTQEASDQLMSTIRQFTQVAPSSQAVPSSPPPSTNTNTNTHESQSFESAPSSPPLKTEHETQPVNFSSQYIKPESRSPTPEPGETIPSSQQPTPRLPGPSRAATPRVPGLSQATTVDLSQLSPSRNDIIFESPRRHVLSSTPMRLPRLPKQGSADGDGIRARVLEGSSQLMTRSQMLPESLLGDSLPGPPMFVGDSEDDEDFDD